MSRSDYTVICSNGRFQIIHKQTQNTIKIGNGGSPTAEEWLKQYLRK